MSKKIDFHLKILYQLLLNARIKNKEISKLVYKSPQLVSYWVEKLEKENIIQAYKIQIDPAKFGLIDIQVFMIFTTSDKKRQNEIITYLKDSDHVTFIENITHGADLLIEYTVPNLSFFNKLHSRFLDLFSGSIKVIDLFPVIVKHYLSKKYINKNAKPENSSIVSGDRKPVSLSGNEKKVLSVLFKDPKASIINIAQKTKLDTRTVLKIKKSLEKEKIIRKYTITLNYEKLNIFGCILLVNFDYTTPSEVNKVIEFLSTIPEVTTVTKVIGRYQLMVRIESLSDYMAIIYKIRNESKFFDFQIYRIGNIEKNTYIPGSVLD